MRSYQINSRIITDISYNPHTQKLVIDFRKGSRHCYHEVPTEIYAALMNASSIGRYYQNHIRHKYSFEKVI